MKCDAIGCDAEAVVEAGEFAGLRMCTTHALIEARRANEGYLRERNTWARQMADLRDERDAAIAEAKAMRERAIQIENDLLAALTNVEAERDEWKAVAHDGAFQQSRAEKAEAERDCYKAAALEAGRTLMHVRALAEKFSATPDRHMSHRNVAQSIRTALTQGGAS